MVAKDDFSYAGKMEYRPAAIDGMETDFDEISQGLAIAQKLIAQDAKERDSAKDSLNKKSESYSSV